MIEEVLRWDSPVQFLFRRTTEETEIAGTTIAPGTDVLPVYAAANRDERRFPEAERFDITRNTQGHLAFGYGIHFCLGAPLARAGSEGRMEQAPFVCRFSSARGRCAGGAHQLAVPAWPYVVAVAVRGDGGGRGVIHGCIPPTPSGSAPPRSRDGASSPRVPSR